MPKTVLETIQDKINAGELCIALDEEYGFQRWFWFPGMTWDELACWWKGLSSVTPFYFAPTEHLPGVCISVGAEVTLDKKEYEKNFSAWLKLHAKCGGHIHQDNDSGLWNNGKQVFHAGYSNLNQE